MSTKAKPLRQVETAQREVDRWQAELAKLEAQAKRARASSDIAERARQEAALITHTGGEATATLTDLRRAVKETKTRAEELESSTELATKKLDEAREALKKAQHEAVGKLATAATQTAEAKRTAAFDAIDRLATALAELDVAAQVAAGYNATLAGIYTPEAALRGQASADLTHYRRQMPAHAIAQRVKEVCAPRLRDSWPP